MSIPLHVHNTAQQVLPDHTIALFPLFHSRWNYFLGANAHFNKHLEIIQSTVKKSPQKWQLHFELNPPILNTFRNVSKDSNTYSNSRT